jgi:hypothetical protein
MRDADSDEHFKFLMMKLPMMQMKLLLMPQQHPFLTTPTALEALLYNRPDILMIQK